MSSLHLEWNLVEQQLESLRALVEELRREVGALRAENVELQRENAELRQQVNALCCEVAASQAGPTAAGVLLGSCAA